MVRILQFLIKDQLSAHIGIPLDIASLTFDGSILARGNFGMVRLVIPLKSRLILRERMKK
jgi:hypothetical protein